MLRNDGEAGQNDRITIKKPNEILVRFFYSFYLWDSHGASPLRMTVGYTKGFFASTRMTVGHLSDIFAAFAFADTEHLNFFAVHSVNVY